VFQQRLFTAGAYLEGGRGPAIELFLAPFMYSLTWFLPNHVYNLCRIAW